MAAIAVINLMSVGPVLSIYAKALLSFAHLASDTLIDNKPTTSNKQNKHAPCLFIFVDRLVNVYDLNGDPTSAIVPQESLTFWICNVTWWQRRDPRIGRDRQDVDPHLLTFASHLAVSFGSVSSCEVHCHAPESRVLLVS